MISPASKGLVCRSVLTSSAFPPGVTATFESGPESVVVKIIGCSEATGNGVPLSEEIWNEVRQRRIYRMFVDLSGLRGLSTYVVRQLIAVGAQVCDHGGMMQLGGMTDDDRIVLRRYGLRERVPDYDEKREKQLSQQAWRWK